MLYKIKRNFQYYLKCIDVYLKAKHKYKEISKAYDSIESKKRAKFSITPAIIVKISIWFLILLSIILSIVNFGTIVKTVKFFANNIQKNKLVEINNTTQPIKNVSDSLSEKNKKVKHQDTKQTTNDSMAFNSLVNKQTQVESQTLYNHSLLTTTSMNYMLYANKADKTLRLLKNNRGSWFVFRTYAMAIGENLGRKMKAGDKKTPEGLYFVIGRKEGSELSSIYGPLAYVLNYPNEDDIINKRTGSGIWIHGTNPDSLPIQTRGCLEMNNSSLVELSEFLIYGIGTPIKIVNEENLLNPIQDIDFKKVFEERRQIIFNYMKKREFFVTILKTWENAWESRDINKYSYYYNSDNFFGQGLKWDAWKEKKLRTFKAYEMIEISLDKIFLADYSESTAVLKFLQSYKSDKIHVINGKKLQFVNNNGKWKIYRENTFPKEEHLL